MLTVFDPVGKIDESLRFVHDAIAIDAVNNRLSINCQKIRIFCPQDAHRYGADRALSRAVGKYATKPAAAVFALRVTIPGTVHCRIPRGDLREEPGCWPHPFVTEACSAAAKAGDYTSGLTVPLFGEF